MLKSEGASAGLKGDGEKALAWAEEPEKWGEEPEKWGEEPERWGEELKCGGAPNEPRMVADGLMGGGGGEKWICGTGVGEILKDSLIFSALVMYDEMVSRNDSRILLLVSAL